MVLWNIPKVKVHMYTSMYFCHFFPKENNFCDFRLLYCPMELFQKEVYCQGKELASRGANSFLSEFIPFEKEAKKW